MTNHDPRRRLLAPSIYDTYRFVSPHNAALPAGNYPLMQVMADSGLLPLNGISVEQVVRIETLPGTWPQYLLYAYIYCMLLLELVLGKTFHDVRTNPTCRIGHDRRGPFSVKSGQFLPSTFSKFWKLRTLLGRNSI
jgi:hypothetical protein